MAFCLGEKWKPSSAIRGIPLCSSTPRRHLFTTTPNSTQASPTVLAQASPRPHHHPRAPIHPTPPSTTKKWTASYPRDLKNLSRPWPHLTLRPSHHSTPSNPSGHLIQTIVNMCRYYPKTASANTATVFPRCLGHEPGRTPHARSRPDSRGHATPYAASRADSFGVSATALR